MQKSRRWVEDGFVSRAECHELIDVHRTCGVVGYRDRFSVTTLREPLARPTPDWPLLMPLARLRGTPHLHPPTALHLFAFYFFIF
jgi:hypothetical protein